MNILRQLSFYAQNHGQDIAVRFQNSYLTYQELDHYSGRLAAYIQNQCGENRAPIVVYGHKNVYMLVCFLAAAKSGRAYCPLDTSVPDNRVEAIVKTAEPSMIFALEDTAAELNGAVSLEETIAIIKETDVSIGEQYQVKGSDIFYIIFTSGSTGTPKGVQITADNLNHYLEWSVGLGTPIKEKIGKVFLNQAPFSFDLSVMDLYTLSLIHI